jgi:iron complex transport system ATP-binding protein
MNANALRCEGLTARYPSQAHPVLHHIDLALPQGRWTSIVGPNGAGKSSLLMALAGLMPGTQGSIWLQDRPLAQWSRQDKAKALAWLGQKQPSTDDLRVTDVVMLGRIPHQGWLSLPSAADMQAVAHAMHLTQCEEWRDRPFGDLSGGEQQRVLLARALAVQASVLLMDEPLSNLDPPHQADWLAITRQLVQEGTTVVSVLHELPFALQSDELVIMAKGQVVHQGLSADPGTHRALEQVFDHRIAIHRVAGQWTAMPRI